MKLTGSLSLAVPARFAAEALHDPDVLETFLPGNSPLTRIGPATFEFVVTKDAGVMTLRLPGTLTVVPEDGGYRFVAKAKHMLGGSATLSLRLDFAPEGDGCVLSYDGTLESTGLAGRLLRDQEDQAQTVMTAKFVAVKARVERSYRTANA